MVAVTVVPCTFTVAPTTGAAVSASHTKPVTFWVTAPDPGRYRLYLALTARAHLGAGYLCDGCGSAWQTDPA